MEKYPLKKQINKKFVWLIVDDGSTDEITDVVKLFTKKARFTQYFKKFSLPGNE